MTGEVALLYAVTVVLREALPPAPEHCRVNVRLLVRLLNVWLPDVAREPLQAPDAVHPVALVELHVTVEAPP